MSPERSRRKFPEIVSSRGIIIVEQPSLIPQQREIDELIALLSRPTQHLTDDEYTQSIVQRQRAVEQFLFRGGVEMVRKFFRRIKDLEARAGAAIKLDLSMLDFNGKLLGDLYLPGANLEKIIFTDSDLTKANLHSANLDHAIGVGTILRGADLRGARFHEAIFPGADFSGARAMGARFINTDLTDLILDEKTNFAGAVFVGTYLRGTDLSVANIPGITVRGIRD